MKKRRKRLDWSAILPEAEKIVLSYDTPVTLRQLFYRLVAAQLIPNDTSAYKILSDRTAKARRAGTFPNLADYTREIQRYRSFGGPEEAVDWLADIYRRDRTEGQECAVYLVVEKATMTAQLMTWFGDFGVRVAALRGYSSETYIQDLVEDIAGELEARERPAVVLYAGDFDPSGEDIERDFRARSGTGFLKAFIRVALTPDQVQEYALPELPGKATDSRAPGFEERHGRLVQVELEALEPGILRELFTEHLNQYMDMFTFERVLEQETADRLILRGGIQT